MGFNWKFWQGQVEKSHAGEYGALAPFVPTSGNVNAFKSFLKGGTLSVDHRLAYSLHDRAAPLANATNMIADSVAQLDLFVIDSENVKVEDSELLSVLNAPGFGQTRTQIIEDFTLSFLLTNNAYWITDKFQKTLRTAKPFNVSPRASQRDSYAEEYRVTMPNGSNQASFVRQDDWTFTDRFNNQLLHIKTKTNDDGLEGRSPIEPIFTDIGQRISGGTHNLAMLTNGLRPTGSFSTEGDLSDEQYGRLKEQVEKQHAGADNAGGFFITEGGLKYIDMAKTNREMDYVKIIESSDKAIAQAYRVPLPLVTSDAQTFDNFDKSTQAFYDDAVFPVAEIVIASISTILGIEEGFTLTFDKTEVPAIRLRRLNEAQTKHKIGAFSDNETRLDLAMEPYEGGDIIYKPSTSIAVGSDDGALDEGEIEGEDEDEDEDKEFIEICVKDGMTEAEAKALWSTLNG